MSMPRIGRHVIAYGAQRTMARCRDDAEGIAVESFDDLASLDREFAGHVGDRELRDAAGDELSGHRRKLGHQIGDMRRQL